MEPNRDWDLEIERYLAGGMADAEIEEFLKEIRQAPAQLARLGQALNLQSLLHEILYGARNVKPAQTKNDTTRAESARRMRALCALAAGALPTRQRLHAARRVGRMRWLLVAACLALVVGAAVVYLKPKPRIQQAQANIAALLAADTGVLVTRAGRLATPTKAGMTICAGDTVKTPAHGKATIQYVAGGVREETRLELSSGTDACFWREQGAKRVKLERGTIDCDVVKQPEGRRMVLITPHGEALVVGTKFRLGVTADETTLAVREGKVVLRQGKEELEVAAGQTAVATGRGKTALASAAGLRMLTSVAPQDVRPSTPTEVRQAGTVWAWGKNNFGQLGDGTTTSRLNPAAVKLPDGTPLSGVTAMAATCMHTAALKSDSTVWAWGGDNKSGQLGDGTTTARLSPVQVKMPDGTPFRGVTALAAGTWHTLALKRDGTIWAWGNNVWGQLGDGTTTNRHFPTQVKKEDGTPFGGVTAIGAQIAQTVALNADGTVWSFGYDGVIDTYEVSTQVVVAGSKRLAPAQVKLPDGTPFANVKIIAAGSSYTLALKTDGTLWAWGENGSGQLGDGTTAHRCAPVQVKMSDRMFRARVTAIAAGNFHTLAVTADGSLWAWGENSHGELGDGSTTNTLAPVRVKLSESLSNANVTAISAGGWHVLALTVDGEIWAWGDNRAGQLGIGAIKNSLAPVRAPGVTNVTAIAAGLFHSAVLVGEQREVRSE